MPVRLLFILMGICFCTPAFAHREIAAYQLCLEDSTENILYQGFPNKVRIENLPRQSRVKFRGQFIKPVRHEYTLVPGDEPSDTLFVVDETGWAIFSKVYVSKPLGSLTVQVGNVKRQIASVADIMANPVINIGWGDSHMRSHWRIQKYTISIKKDTTFETKTISGSNLTSVPIDAALRASIAEMKNGDKIFIEDIRAYGPDNEIRTLASLIILIVLEKSGWGTSTSPNSYLRDDLRVVVDAMSRGEMSTNDDVGWVQKLLDVATDSELIQLTNHKDALVRCYAFKALTYRTNIDPFPVLLKHIHDTATVKGHSGCIGTTWPTNEYFLGEVWPTRVSKDRSKLTAQQEMIIDSILLFDTRIERELGNHFLPYMRPYPAHYNKIRRLAASGKRPLSVLLLAKYQCKRDTGIIKKLFEKGGTESYGIEAACRFPDPSFYPLLKKAFEKELVRQLQPLIYPGISDELYKALVRYPSEETCTLFARIAEFKDEVYTANLRNLLLAIAKYPDPIFEPLIAKFSVSEELHNEVARELKDYSW